MSNRKIDPRQQFSKKLAGRAEWFWFGYMVLILILLYFQPGVSDAVIYLAGIVTVVMVTSVLAYTSNSKYDKALYTLRVLGWKSEDKSSSNSDESSDESEDNCDAEPDEKEGGNG